MRLPTREELFSRRGMRWLRPLARSAHFRDFSAEAVARGLGLGVGVGMLPIPFQMVPAVLAAVLLRGNIPVAVAGVWVSNPLTWVPLYYFNYRVGAHLLGRAPAQETAGWDEVLLELWLGSLLVMVLAGGLAYLAARLAGALRQGSKRLPEGEQRQVDGE